MRNMIHCSLVHGKTTKIQGFLAPFTVSPKENMILVNSVKIGKSESLYEL